MPATLLSEARAGDISRRTPTNAPDHPARPNAVRTASKTQVIMNSKENAELMASAAD
jgi:formylmethanofuran dehydrogenase subunit E-like metal-binding protein